MKDRGLKLIALLAILALTLGVTGVALAAEPSAPKAMPKTVGQDTCPEGDGWVKYEGLDGTTFTMPSGDIPDGYHVEGNCFKAGTELVFGSGPTVTNTTVWNKDDCPDAEGCNLVDISHASFELVPDEYEVCSETVAVPGEWSDWSDWFWNGEQFERTRTRTVTYVDSENREYVCDEVIETEHEFDPACPWNPEIRAGDLECQPPPGETGGSLTLSCGGSLTATILEGAELWVVPLSTQIAVEMNAGENQLEPGDYHFYWEHDLNYEFPDGFETEGDFTINRCPTPDREPKTGPEATLPIAAGVSLLGFLGLAAFGVRRLKH